MSDNYCKAFNQTLPLITFSIIFQFLSLVNVANCITQVAVGGCYIQWMFFLHAVASWGFFGGLFIIIYVIATGQFSKENIKDTLKKWCFKNKNGNHQ